MTTGAPVLLVLDLVGVFAFALNGALTALRVARLDVVGVVTLGMITALGGGIIRDVLLGDLPPTGLTTWWLLLACAVAGVAAFFWHPAFSRWEGVLLGLDAAGLALFCVNGARKASDAGLDVVPAALLGMITGIGGGIVRDVLANRVPVVLQGGWYAVPALAGATWAAGAHQADLPALAVVVPGVAVCFGWRVLAVRFGWTPLPARGTG
jgi:uncharacterized membrane protein YeiH